MHDLYMDILIKKGEVLHELHARLVHAVHQVQTEDFGLAVSFPDWSKNKGDFGLIFRVFGASQNLLESFRNHVKRLEDNGLIRFFPILPVPETKSKICFARDQSASKNSPSAQRRREKRGCQERVASWPSHFLKMKSSGGNTFSLGVTKSSREREGGRRYGLGFLVANF